MKIVTDARAYTAEGARGGPAPAGGGGAPGRRHWTDQPYVWHANDGTEVFVVLAGEVEMRFRQDGQEKAVRLGPSDIFVAEVGDEHVAHPIGEARVLVVEKKGSV